MGACTSKVSGFWNDLRHHPDEVLAYNTFKIVVIKDKVLGIIHHSFQILIILYVILHPIWWQKTFLERDPAIGPLHMSLKRSATTTNTTILPSYCAANSSLLQLNFPQKLPCEKLAPDQVVAGASEGSLFISTHFTVTPPTNCAICGGCDICANQNSTRPNQFFVNSLNDYIISIDHSPRAINLPIEIGDSITGQLQKLKKGTQEWEDVEYFNSLAADEIPLTKFLEVAGVDLDESANDYLSPAPENRQSGRFFGVVIVMMLVYDNIKDWYTERGEIHYYYRPSIIAKIDDFVEESIYINYPTNRYIVNRRGIRIVGIVTGQFGQFSFTALLLQLATGLALIKVSTTIVDAFAIYILPLKVYYKNAKFSKTEEFADIKARRKMDRTNSERPKSMMTANVEHEDTVNDSGVALEVKSQKH